MNKMEDFKFVVGEVYSNRRMRYTVLDIQDSELIVQFEDGTTGTLNKDFQHRIIGNMIKELDFLTSTPNKSTQAREDLRHEFIFSVGFLSARARLRAEVPPRSKVIFEKRYQEKTGNILSNTTNGYCILSKDEVYNKWGPELRIVFPAEERELAGLYFGEQINVQNYKSFPDVGLYVINNNAFFYHLLEMGFDIGNRHDPDNVQKRIPTILIDDFNRGFQKGLERKKGKQ
jgi:hypothetical protein